MKKIVIRNGDLSKNKKKTQNIKYTFPYTFIFYPKQTTH